MFNKEKPPERQIELHMEDRGELQKHRFETFQELNGEIVYISSIIEAIECFEKYGDEEDYKGKGSSLRELQIAFLNEVADSIENYEAGALPGMDQYNISSTEEMKKELRAKLERINSEIIKRQARLN